MKIYLNKLRFLTRNANFNHVEQISFLKKQKFYFRNPENKQNDMDNNEEPLSIRSMTSQKLNEIRKEIDGKIVDGQCNINALPTPNYFGEVPVFLAPVENFAKRNNIEKSGLALITSITVLNYLGLLYPPSFFYYFVFLTAAGAFKLASDAGQRNQIILMTLVDDKNVRCQYLNGKEEIVTIKSIIYNQNDRLNAMINPEEDILKKRGIQSQKMSNNSLSSQESSRMLMISVMINASKKVIILRNNILPNKKDLSSNYAFIDLNILLAVVNKKTKRINFDVKS